MNVTQSLASAAAADARGGGQGSAAERRQARQTLALREANRGRVDAYLQKHRLALESEARRYLTSPSAAEDAVQEAALKALTTDNPFNPVGEGSADGGFRAWFYTILRNVCIDSARSSARPGVGTPFTHFPEIVIEEATVDPALSPCDQLFQKMGLTSDRWEEAREAFHRLSGTDKAVLIECIVNEREEVDVARAWGFTPGAIRSRLMSARNAMRLRVWAIIDTIADPVLQAQRRANYFALPIPRNCTRTTESLPEQLSPYPNN